MNKKISTLFLLFLYISIFLFNFYTEQENLHIISIFLYVMGVKYYEKIRSNVGSGGLGMLVMKKCRGLQFYILKQHGLGAHIQKVTAVQGLKEVI